jgi:hypothetical protein
MPTGPVSSPPCPRCHSTETRTEVLPVGSVHYAKLLCAGCGRYLRFLPRQESKGGQPSAGTIARVHDRVRPAVLRGTDKQCLAARSIRENMLYRAQRRNDLDCARLLRCVADATWFLANRSAQSPEEFRWPAPNQMESAEPTGACDVCGAPTYSDQFVCSDQCKDRYIADRIAEGNRPSPASWF